MVSIDEQLQIEKKQDMKNREIDLLKELYKDKNSEKLRKVRSEINL